MVDPQTLSEALVCWTGWGTEPWPRCDKQRVLERFGGEAVLDLLPLIKAIEVDFYESNAYRVGPTLVDIGDQAASEFRERHPEIDEDAVLALRWCYTFDYKWRIAPNPGGAGQLQTALGRPIRACDGVICAPSGPSGERASLLRPAVQPGDHGGVAMVEEQRGAGVESGNTGHLFGGEIEVGDVDVLAHALGANRLGDYDDASLG